MPRLQQISRDQVYPNGKKLYEAIFGDRDPVTQPGTATGTPGNWWTVFAGVPDVLDHAVAGFGVYRSKRRKLSMQLRELGQLRAGYARGSKFVFSQHCKAARAVGLTEEKVQAIKAWSVASCYSPVERAVLAYTDCLVLQGGRVPEDLFAALKSHLSDVEILELTYITCLYDMHAVMSRALRLEYDDMDDPIVEVPAPSSGASNDVMSMVDRARNT
jgi:alkylhydroperoxidase family enzyme